ncbi:hypothetical protein AKJ45_00685 [candidate division MSBL1 archaeon SCGC-AAA261F19]|uniref:DUF5667 domain-containing protein n=1 Tax=candidate division MSBL1 archaeon SCGC-AAA261F19 TaxID=1698275 RepID=A0A133VBC6_9EURY|nr:hypothetical protein AKJ45_00685 [candidate division MSBL1 archaeon SCGC-AAA261F19]
MLNMSEAGVATATVLIAVVAVAGGAIGTPLAVDEVDVQPDSPLYGLEKAGEAIKEATFAGGQGWEITRGRERVSEFINMVSKGKSEDYTGLLNNAGDRFSKAIESAGNVEGLQKAQEAVDWHISVLENVRENVPEAAKPAISLAISRSTRGKAVITEVAAGELPGGELMETTREEIRNRLRNIRQEIENLRSQIKENLEAGDNISEIASGIVQNVELGTAMNLANKIGEIGENRGEAISTIAGMVQNRIEAASIAAVDNTGLERAVEASRYHLSVLENVYDIVDNSAKPAIGLAMERSSLHIQILENLLENETPPGREITAQIRKMLRNRQQEVETNIEQLQNQFRDRVQEAAGNQEAINSIVEELENRLRERVGITLDNEQGKSPGPNIPGLVP